jgi:sulfite exporter TauE/SafE
MTAADFSTPTAALIAGLVTSLHCAGMCGPLVCATCPSGGLAGARDAAIYHITRIGAYTLLGAVLGWSGQSIGEAFGWPIWHLLPWAFLILFLAIAFAWDLGKFVRIPAFIRRSLSSAAALRGPRGAFLLGLGTPLLPCGPLYLAAGVAAASGSASTGAILMACFGVGTVALLEVLRSQMGRMERRFSPTTLRRIQQGLAVVACFLLALRLAWPSFGPPEQACPLCP